jgi:2'-5' RNA ligase
MRTFVAIDVPDSVKQYARMIRNHLGQSRADIKWVEYQNYHLTVKFLGEVKESGLSSISRQLRLAADSCPVFYLSAGGIGFFPNQRRPRVIWMGIHGEVDKAEFLGERVDAYLSELRFESEREHTLHLTLGRIRSEVNLNELMKNVREHESQTKLIGFKVERFRLMQSELTKTGAIYTELDTYPLKG